ncbi:MAG: multiprotein bridging factor aMBF1 [Candidatus Micrarchaeia archaeon]
MEECELCGKKIEHAYVIEVEGVELRVCAECAEGKRIIKAPKEEARVSKSNYHHEKIMKIKQEENNYELIDNYGKVIREAREKMQLPLKVLAEMLNEKETLLLRIEEQKTLPSSDLLKKIEKALNVNLKIEQKEDGEVNVQNKSSSASLGEFLPK